MSKQKENAKMSLDEAREFFYNNLCSEQAMVITDEEKYQQFMLVVSPEQRLQMVFEFFEMMFEEMTEESENAYSYFRTLLTLLGQRNEKFRNQARKMVEVLEKAPFGSEFGKLIVAEGIVGAATGEWESGYSILCSYGDYADRIHEALKAYLEVHFEKDVEVRIETFQTTLKAEQLNGRMDHVKELNEERFEYVSSNQFRSDLTKFEEQYR